MNEFLLFCLFFSDIMGEIVLFIIKYFVFEIFCPSLRMCACILYYLFEFIYFSIYNKNDTKLYWHVSYIIYIYIHKVYNGMIRGMRGWGQGYIGFILICPCIPNINAMACMCGGGASVIGQLA